MSNQSLPPRFTYPFCYEPHPLCVDAAEELKRYIRESHIMDGEPGGGKMFGVLIVEDGDGHVSHLAAYSGLLAGRNDWPGFVPPVFDAQQPDGYFKIHERQISTLNEKIEAAEHAPVYAAAREALVNAETETKAETDSYRAMMKEAKSHRSRIRQRGGLSSEEEAALTRESQFQKAELHRMKLRAARIIETAKAKVEKFERHIATMKTERKTMSDNLQHWLFSQYSMLNARGERRSLLSIFADTPSGVPPAGAGDCCAPKLLQYAYSHNLRPVCMAEFWYGHPPKNELRRHGCYYPACSGKCKPILAHMLQGLAVDPDPLQGRAGQDLEIVYQDEELAVVCKPAGMLSVPGRDRRRSVLSLMRRLCPEAEGPMAVHRLDMDTSGLMLVAKTADAYRCLQRQFLDRTIHKEYIALLDGTSAFPQQGRIDLPLRPDPFDRPRQIVDRENGKPAVTLYNVLRKETITDSTGTQHAVTRIQLFPQTGRTHQLRVHCAHSDGLGLPILGDPLYGNRSDRLYLHAVAITFIHPITKKEMTFRHNPDF